MVLTKSYAPSKNVLRAQMLELRSQLGPDKVSQMSRDLCKNLLFVFAEGGGLGDPKNKPLWGAYKSFRWEADPAQAIAESTPYIRWAFPKTLSDSLMEFYEPKATDANWLKNTWGIWEPDPRTSDKQELNSFAGILVPGVAFDRNGARLGYGKGFYDRALSSFKGLKVGVSFSVQVTETALPVNDNDVLMDILVTDNEIIQVRKH